MDVPAIQLTVESRIRNVRLVGAAVHRLCRETPLSAEAAHRVELCVTEAVVNCIKHAYGSRTDQAVCVTLVFKPEELMITVSDQGRPMPPHIAASLGAGRSGGESREKVPRLSTSGRGLSIITAFMDHVIYRSAEGRNDFIMHKLTQHRKKPRP